MTCGCDAVNRTLNALRWTMVERMIWAWLLTIPASGLAAYLLVQLGCGTGLIP